MFHLIKAYSVLQVYLARRVFEATCRPRSGGRFVASSTRKAGCGSGRAEQGVVSERSVRAALMVKVAAPPRPRLRSPDVSSREGRHAIRSSRRGKAIARVSIVGGVSCQPPSAIESTGGARIIGVTIPFTETGRSGI